MAGYQEYDIRTGLITPEQTMTESRDVIRWCVAEMLRLIDATDVQNEEERTRHLANVNSRITFELRRINNAIENEKSNAPNHSSKTNP